MTPDHIIEKALYPAAAAIFKVIPGDGARAAERAAVEALRAGLAAVYADIQAEALRDAAASYQLGGWALAMPAGSDRPALILGMAQRAINWLRARADELDGGTK